MKVCDEDIFPRDATGAAPGSLVRAVEATLRDFHESHDLFVLQERCEALARCWGDDQQGRAAVEWVATQAELMDCGLVAGSWDSLESALRDLLSG